MSRLRLRASVGNRETYEFLTRDGLRSQNGFRPAELQLLDAVADRPPNRLLVAEANYGVVGTVAAGLGIDVRQIETSARAAWTCRENADRNRVDAPVRLTGRPDRWPGPFDAAACVLAPDEPLPLGRQRIADALTSVDAGGTVYLAAKRNTGLRRYRETVDRLAASVRTVGGDGEVRVVAATRPDGSFDAPTYLTRNRIGATVRGVSLTFVTEPGLFSNSGLDDGTRRLLETVDLPENGRVLDLCCGYGPIGCLVARTTDCTVTLADDDWRAAECARASLRANDLKGEVRVTDACRGLPEAAFDRVLCNPPGHAGDGVLADIAAGARRILAPDGRFDAAFPAGAPFDEHLGRSFDSVTTVDESGPYHLLTARP